MLVKMDKKNKILNQFNRFNTTQPILDSLYDDAYKHGGELSDYAFSIACEEYETQEDAVMELMISSEHYKFKRFATGWFVTENS